MSCFTSQLDEFGPECLEQLLGHLRHDSVFAETLSARAWSELLTTSRCDWSVFKEFAWAISKSLNSMYDSKDDEASAKKRQRTSSNTEGSDNKDCDVVELLISQVLASFETRFIADVVGCVDSDSDALLLCRWLHGAFHLRYCVL